MAYFSNSTDGECFDNQCNECKYGQEPCPIAFVQLEYNYDACNNKVATNILNHLVDNEGNCKMFQAFKNDFKIDAHQLKLF